MKKLILIFTFFGCTLAIVAQNTEVPVKRQSVATNSFWANWFVSLGMDFNATYSGQEQSVSNNPFSDKRGVVGFDAAIGKWFTSGIGLRTKFRGVWGKTVMTEKTHPLHLGFDIHEDVMFNLTNMFCGYKANRIYNASPYLGIGIAGDFDADRYSLSYNVGLLNNFRVTRHWSLFLDIYAIAKEGKVVEGDAVASKNRFKSSLWDKTVGFSFGVTYNIGRCTWEKTPDIDALMAMHRVQVNTLNTSLNELQSENTRLRDMLGKKQEVVVTKVVEKVVVDPVKTPHSVFFNSGSAEIASRKDLVGVREVAEYAKANGAKIVVNGYADSKTGSEKFNKKLSERRANVVADELVKMGVARDNIIVNGRGGVDSLEPYSYNRRVIVMIW